MRLPKMQLSYTAEEFHKLIRDEIFPQYNSQTEMADSLKCSVASLHNCIHRDKQAPIELCNALGYRRVRTVSYHYERT
jgi:hypothetical protein